MYIAHSIGFGLPRGLFFKVRVKSIDGPSINLKIGGADNEWDAKKYAVERAAAWLSERRGLAEVTARECGQFEAV